MVANANIQIPVHQQTSGLSQTASLLKGLLRTGGLEAVKDHLSNTLPFGAALRQRYICALYELLGLDLSDLSDQDCQQLHGIIEARAVQITAGPPNRPKVIARMKPVNRRERLQKRAKLAGAHTMPYEMRALFWKTCHLAVISVIANAACRNKGSVELSVKEIADIAQCSKSSVRSAIRELCENGKLAKVERRVARNRNLPNLLIIVCQSWLSWLGKCKKLRRGGFKKSDGLKNTIYIKGKNCFSILVRQGFEALGVLNMWDLPHLVPSRSLE